MTKLLGNPASVAVAHVRTGLAISLVELLPLLFPSCSTKLQNSKHLNISKSTQHTKGARCLQALTSSMGRS